MIAVAFLAAGCASPRAGESRLPTPEPAISFAGGNGSTMKDAIIVMAPNEQYGIEAEYALLRRVYAPVERPSQSLVRDRGRSYDVMEVVDSKGTRHTVYFDITSFFGKH